jgi:hypothetical protein
MDNRGVPITVFLPAPITADIATIPAGTDTGILAEARNLTNRLQESGVIVTHAQVVEQ